MTSGADIVTEARKWVGTPFRHQGRLIGVGADCAGMVLGVGRALDLLAYDAAPIYGRRPNGDTMRQLLEEYGERVAPGQPIEAGDVLLFAFIGEPQHLGIATGDGNLIHVYAQARKCVEHQLDEVWRARIRGNYRFRGLERARKRSARKREAS